MTYAPQNQNQFAQTPVKGDLDQLFNTDTISAQVASTQVTPLVPGQAVKVVDNSSGVPQVVACALNTDPVFGYVTFNLKDKTYPANSRLELSLSLNVIYLQAATTIARGAQVTMAEATGPGYVAAAVSGDALVGFAYDKAVAIGDLIRVFLTSVPSFELAP